MKVENLNIQDEYTTVNEDDSILVIAKKIADTKIPDVVVINKENEALGALDGYDIVTKVIAKEKSVEKTTAKEIMYAVPPVHLDTEIERVADIMQELEVSVIPVTDEGRKLLGVVTHIDLINAYQQKSWIAQIFRRG